MQALTQGDFFKLMTFVMLLCVRNTVCNCFPPIGAHIAFLRECFAGCGIRSSYVCISRCPHPFLWGCAPYPLLCIWAPFVTHALQAAVTYYRSSHCNPDRMLRRVRDRKSVRLHKPLPAPDLWGLRPQTPVCDIQAPVVTHPLQAVVTCYHNKRSYSKNFHFCKVFRVESL